MKNKWIKLIYYPEGCCDYCSDTLHNHFECPVCKNDYAGTNFYDHIGNLIDEKTILECEECGSTFKIKKDKEALEYKIKLITNQYN